MTERTQLSRDLAERLEAAEERNADLEELLGGMFAELVDWAPNSISQLWADRMESVGVYADWGWRG